MADKLLSIGDGISSRQLRDIGGGASAEVVVVAGGGVSKVIVTGEYKFGKFLTASPAPGWSWAAGKWVRNGVDISGATALSYQMGQDDVGQNIGFVPTNPVEVSVVQRCSADVPGAPTIGTATAGEGSVTLNGTAPASNGGSAIIGYRGRLNTGVEKTSETLPVVFTGLAGGFAYSGIIQALNGIGYGPESAASNTVIPSSALVTNIAARVWQTNTGFTNAQSAYNGNGADLMPAGGGTGTCMVITDFASDCTHIQIVMGNNSAVQPRRVIGFTAVCPSATGDNCYNTEFASAAIGTFNGGQSFIDVPPRDPSATSVGMAVSDPYPVTPVLRTDAPGKRRLLAIREAAIYPTANETTNYPVPTVSRSGSGWGNDSAGILLAQGINGNKLNSAWPTGSAPWVNGNCTIVGVIFHYKKRASSIAFIGSSLTKCDLNTPSTKKGSGWPMQSTIAVSTEDNPVEFINCGQAGQQLVKGLVSAQTVIPLLKPTHVAIEFANPNNLSQVNAGTIDTLRTNTADIRALAAAYGARPILWNGWPRNVAASPSLASYFPQAQDDLRKAYLEEMRALGLPYMDTNALMGKGVSPDTIKMTGNGDAASYTDAGDGLHQNDTATVQVLTPGWTSFLTAEVINKYHA